MANGDVPGWLLYIQGASYIAGAASAVVAAAKYRLDLNSAFASRAKELKQRRADTAAREEANRIADRDLSWRRMAVAQTILEQVEEDDLAVAAMTMLDWKSRRYVVDGQKHVVTEQMMCAALRTKGDAFTPVEVFVRDAFDHLLWFFERIQNQIDIGMIELQHVRFPLAYLVGLMNQNRTVFDDFIASYGYTGAKMLVDELGLRLNHSQNGIAAARVTPER